MAGKTLWRIQWNGSLESYEKEKLFAKFTFGFETIFTRFLWKRKYCMSMAFNFLLKYTKLYSLSLRSLIRLLSICITQIHLLQFHLIQKSIWLDFSYAVKCNVRMHMHKFEVILLRMNRFTRASSPNNIAIGMENERNRRKRDKTFYRKTANYFICFALQTFPLRWWYFTLIISLLKSETIVIARIKLKCWLENCRLKFWIGINNVMELATDSHILFELILNVARSMAQRAVNRKFYWIR